MAQTPVTSRDRILERIRAGAHHQVPRPRLPEAPAPEGDLLELLQDNLTLAAASHQRCSTQELPAAVAAYLQRNQLPAKLWVSDEAGLVDFHHPDIELHHESPGAETSAALTGALAGIAETGSLVLHSGADRRTALNFLADHHLVVLPVRSVVACIEDAWPLLRELPDWPRTVNIITGPSRTADIEQTIQMGAHGPRSLHILLVH
ncbi:MAG: lactate utilization protein [Gammaproteobacteria bacterium]|nr:lactate utilization protein [Gammaproteobacteria bacterium]